jgi:hypothetical protein
LLEFGEQTDRADATTVGNRESRQLANKSGALSNFAQKLNREQSFEGYSTAASYKTATGHTYDSLQRNESGQPALHRLIDLLNPIEPLAIARQRIDQAETGAGGGLIAA